MKLAGNDCLLYNTILFKFPGDGSLLFTVEFHYMLHCSQLAKMKLPGNDCLFFIDFHNSTIHV